MKLLLRLSINRSALQGSCSYRSFLHIFTHHVFGPCLSYAWSLASSFILIHLFELSASIRFFSPHVTTSPKRPIFLPFVSPATPLFQTWRRKGPPPWPTSPTFATCLTRKRWNSALNSSNASRSSASRIICQSRPSRSVGGFWFVSWLLWETHLVLDSQVKVFILCLQLAVNDLVTCLQFGLF